MATRTTKAPAKTTKTAAKSKTAPSTRAATKTAPKGAAKTATAAKRTTAKPKTPVAPAAKAAPKPVAKTKTAAVAKAETEKKGSVYPTSIADKKPWQAGAKVNKRTGFTEGTISDKIAAALIKGGKSRADIVNSLPDLPKETRKGTKFQAANVAATVERQMRAMGFQVVQSYKLVAPKRTSA